MHQHRTAGLQPPAIGCKALIAMKKILTLVLAVNIVFTVKCIPILSKVARTLNSFS